MPSAYIIFIFLAGGLLVGAFLVRWLSNRPEKITEDHAPVPSLPIPTEITKLFEDGAWPTTDIPKEFIASFAPDEDALSLYPPPLRTVAQDSKQNKYWFDERNALHEIDPELALFLGDFGIGSDTAIILDYRSGEPQLMRLVWGEKQNHWINIDLSISEFCDLIKKGTEQTRAANSLHASRSTLG